MYRCRALKKNGRQCRQCGKPQQSGGPILMGFCDYHQSQRAPYEYDRAEHSLNQTEGYTIPQDIKSYLNKVFEKDEYRKLMKKYHPDKSSIFTTEKLTHLSQIINEHKF